MPLKLFGRKSSAPKLDLKHPLVIALSKDLQALHALPIGSKEDREAWHSAAEKFHRKLYEEYKTVYDSLPHELEHYLVDSDIRAKDKGYARYQEKLLEDFLALEQKSPTSR